MATIVLTTKVAHTAATSDSNVTPLRRTIG
jgi:hypothetical protein